MGVDVIDGARIDPGIAKGKCHRVRRSLPLVVRLGDVARVAGGTVPLELAIDAGAAAAGMLEFLDDRDSGPLGEHESVAIGIEGTAGLLG